MNAWSPVANFPFIREGGHGITSSWFAPQSSSDQYCISITCGPFPVCSPHDKNKTPRSTGRIPDRSSWSKFPQSPFANFAEKRVVGARPSEQGRANIGDFHRNIIPSSPSVGSPLAVSNGPRQHDKSGGWACPIRLDSISFLEIPTTPVHTVPWRSRLSWIARSGRQTQSFGAVSLLGWVRCGGSC